MLQRVLLSIFLFILITGCVFAYSQTSQTSGSSRSSDAVTIVTYYPAPCGVYKNLKLNPSTQPKPAESSPGLMYFDKGEGTVKYYNNDKKWVDLTETSSTCVLVPFTSTSSAKCPVGYYTWSGMQAAPSGQMLCCKVKNPPTP